MIKNITFVVLIALRVFYQPVAAKETMVPFISPTPLPSPTATVSAKVISFHGSISNEKAILQWTVSANENAAQFEVEKSSDGKNFTMAALVFGTDKANTDNYQFYEKKGAKEITYRIKIINKNQSVEYSSLVDIKP